MRLADPVRIHAADICRDGGSYVLVYEDSAANRYELELRVVTDAEFRRVGYEVPIILSYSENSRVDLTWDAATELGLKLASLLVAPIEWGGLSRAQACVEALSLRGGVPRDV